MKKFTESVGFTQIMRPFDFLYRKYRDELIKMNVKIEDPDVSFVQAQEQTVTFSYKIFFPKETKSFKKHLDKIENYFENSEISSYISKYYIFPNVSDYINNGVSMSFEFTLSYTDFKESDIYINLFKSLNGVEKYNL